MFHTVYNSFESAPGGRDYIGKHSTEDPYDDYLGSFKDKSFKPDDKIVFAYSKTKEGAVWLEVMFQRVFGVVEDPQFANKSYQTSDKFVTGFAGEDHPLYGTSRPDVRERNLTNNPSKQPEAAAKIAEAARNRKGTFSEKPDIKWGNPLETVYSRTLNTNLNAGLKVEPRPVSWASGYLTRRIKGRGQGRVLLKLKGLTG